MANLQVIVDAIVGGKDAEDKSLETTMNAALEHLTNESLEPLVSLQQWILNIPAGLEKTNATDITLRGKASQLLEVATRLPDTAMKPFIGYRMCDLVCRDIVHT